MLQDGNILDKMRLGVHYRAPISLNDFECLVRPLSISETLEVASMVTGTMKELPMDQRNRIMEHALLAKLTLVKASQEYGSNKEPVLSDYVLSQMSNDELIHLYKQWCRICDEANPSIEDMSKEELQDLVKQVKKKERQLTGLSISELIALCQHLMSTAD